ncbi:hypothetical protein SteCoe_11902 [Stentor coeruleus]|uniref:LITAF domain-containing protein n=1 Tax=Stentor coeruleus TaxID=5963 RepID=A0A1R2CC56_9CILI|nr:hypothetical protein SteCoe_11902 [Stentor coeruleus]
MKTSSAGRGQRVPSENSSIINTQQVLTGDQLKYSTPKYSSFNISSVLSPKSAIQPSRPFKVLTFDSFASSPCSHANPGIRDFDQKPDFKIPKGYKTYKISNEEPITGSILNQKYSIFASTTDQKSSTYNSLFKKSSLEDEAYKLDDSVNEDNSVTKPDENVTNMDEKSREGDFGILPQHMFCKNCNIETTSIVSIKMPTLPFWRVMCCISSVTDVCSDLESLDRYQEYQHRCRNCKFVLN